nr:hypothetical protein Iba_chr08eCG0160 [Ipomoea batatas]
MEPGARACLDSQCNQRGEWRDGFLAKASTQCVVKVEAIAIANVELMAHEAVGPLLCLHVDANEVAEAVALVGKARLKPPPRGCQS